MITDEMLRFAAAEADQAIRDSLPHPEDCHRQFSPRFERKMKHVIRRGRHPVTYKYLRRAACLLVAVTLVGASWLTVDAEARGAFFAWVRQQYENFVEYRFEGLAPDEEMTTNFAPTWLPEGYEEYEVHSAGGTSIKTYRNSDGQAIHFMYSPGADATSLFVVSDQMTMEKVSVGTQEADFYQDADPENANVLVWQYEGEDILFCISASLPRDEMVKIAESIAAIP
ncbi:hypothetical protein B5F98_06395 [Pseudoflavonifractor sp. An44]|uniref:DUF4367 domain-containing protein n=1 Tax=Pseudoflavonifractor sp. An44 TaxID=1965635 RepID=UPI000B3A4B93|nr:DUF4367 domain-containing protein [Pseudoflavonifractor sp. An44]OUN97353.1 hypothetical protein B5F98_06395 [Pseudoflavonifractor sp. An44]